MQRVQRETRWHPLQMLAAEVAARETTSREFGAPDERRVERRVGDDPRVSVETTMPTDRRIPLQGDWEDNLHRWPYGS